MHQQDGLMWHLILTPGLSRSVYLSIVHDNCLLVLDLVNNIRYTFKSANGELTHQSFIVSVLSFYFVLLSLFYQ